jgi:hypothetical protein
VYLGGALKIIFLIQLHDTFSKCNCKTEFHYSIHVKVVITQQVKTHVELVPCH